MSRSGSILVKMNAIGDDSCIDQIGFGSNDLATQLLEIGSDTEYAAFGSEYVVTDARDNSTRRELRVDPFEKSDPSLNFLLRRIERIVSRLGSGRGECRHHGLI